VSKKLADAGKLIEGGWNAYRLLVVPLDASPVQIDECRLAFMAGAQHLFSSIMAVMDPDSEPTEKDLQKMDLIDKELNVFAREMELRLTRIEGET
jgi:hypothetical protein